MELHEITPESILELVRTKPLSPQEFAGQFGRKNWLHAHTKTILRQLKEKGKVKQVVFDSTYWWVPKNWKLSNDAIYWQIMGRTKEVEGCWEWVGFIDQRSQPWHRITKAMNRPDLPEFLRPRRFLWDRIKADKLGPQDILVPKCGCDNCIRPAHMEKIHRNESLRGRKVLPEQRMRAIEMTRERLGKINMDIAREIRVSDEPTAEVAKRYGISRANVHLIRKGETWREVNASNNPFAGLVA